MSEELWRVKEYLYNEIDAYKQQILRLKNRISELESETQEKNSIASMYQTKALYWQEIAERERKKNKELYSKIELLEGLIDEKITETEILKEEQELDQQVIIELQQLVKEPSKKFIKFNYKEEK